MNDLLKKFIISLFGAILFILISSQQTYNLTNKLTYSKNYFYDECQKPVGQLVHSLLFFIMTFGSMIIGSAISSNYEGLGTKFMYSLLSTLIFSVLSSKSVYSITKNIYSGLVDDNGCPKFVGVLVHSIVYFLIIFGLMFIPQKCQNVHIN